MSKKLLELYRSIDKNVEVIYVFPNIERSSEHNPYLTLLYNDFLLKSRKQTSVKCISAHPLFPVFILKKIFGEKSIIHYHWFEFSDIRGFFVLIWKLSLIMIFKLFNGHIVWTIHNKHLHSKKYLKCNLYLRKIMAKIAAGLHVHCQEAISVMAPVLNVHDNKFHIVEHPFYPVVITDYHKARRQLQSVLFPSININRPIFLMYGNIGKYKGIIDIIPLISDEMGQLIIAGKCKKGEEKYLEDIENTRGGKKNIYLLKRFIEKNEEKLLFNASDCVLFNFHDILSSGSVMLALSYKKSIILPESICFSNLSDMSILKFNSREELKKNLSYIAESIK
jgi:hypothetical protein